MFWHIKLKYQGNTKYPMMKILLQSFGVNPYHPSIAYPACMVSKKINTLKRKNTTHTYTQYTHANTHAHTHISLCKKQIPQQVGETNRVHHYIVSENEMMTVLHLESTWLDFSAKFPNNLVNWKFLIWTGLHVYLVKETCPFHSQKA